MRMSKMVYFLLKENTLIPLCVTYGKQKLVGSTK